MNIWTIIHTGNVSENCGKYCAFPSGITLLKLLLHGQNFANVRNISILLHGSLFRLLKLFCFCFCNSSPEIAVDSGMGHWKPRTLHRKDCNSLIMFSSCIAESLWRQWRRAASGERLWKCYRMLCYCSWNNPGIVQSIQLLIRRKSLKLWQIFSLSFWLSLGYSGQ